MEKRNKDIKDEIFVGHLPVSHQLPIIKIDGSYCMTIFILFQRDAKATDLFEASFRTWPDSRDANDV